MEIKSFKPGSHNLVDARKIKMREMINETLAEVAGIFAGDGTLYKTNRSYVMEVRGHLNEEKYYTDFIIPLFGAVLSCKLKLIKRNCNNSILNGIRKCGKGVFDLFHKKLEFPVGKKETIVKIPQKIFGSNNPKIWISYLRGVFDTDGCVSLKKFKQSKFPIVKFGSVSNSHIEGIQELLKRLGFNARLEKYSVVIAGWKPVKRFFKIIQPHNILKLISGISY